jgi:hypothetical protein
MNPQRARGLTANIAFVFLGDSASTTGAGKTGLTNASAGLNISVRRERSSAMTAYTGANIGAISTLGTWAAPGAGKVNFKEVDATNAPGLYELHFEDSKFDASDTSRCLVGMVTATGVVPAPFEIPLTAVDVQDGIRMALTALPGAAAGAAGGLPTIDSSLRTLANVVAWNGHAVPAENVSGVPKVDTVDFLGQAVVLDANNLIKVDVQDWAAAVVGALPANFSSLAISAGGAVTVGTNNDKTGYSLAVAPPTASAIATQIWQDATSTADFTTAGSIGKLLTDNVDAKVSSRGTSNYAGTDTPGTTTLLSRIASALTITGGAVTVAANNDKTGYALSASGLDAIAVTDPGAPTNVTTIPRMIVALWRRFFRKSTLTATQLKTFADDGTTVNSTQAVSDDGTTQTQGSAS